MNQFDLVIFALVLVSTVMSPTFSYGFELRKGSIISSSHKISISYTECRCSGGKASDDASVAPTTLFIHGLDSSSHTWRGVQQSLRSPSIAIDCRGCGKSDLGDPHLFSMDVLVDDLKSLVNSHSLLHGGKPVNELDNENENGGVRKNDRFVLVGHSMGGRIAMAYASRFPEDISALVIEDMDIRRRSVESNMIKNLDEAKSIAFERGRDSLESITKSLTEIGYPSNMFEKWIGEGRIYEAGTNVGGKRYWCDANPGFRALCYRHIFDSDGGTECWNTIVENCKQMKSDHAKIYLMVAGVGTVCSGESLEEMRKIMSVDEGVRSFLSIKTYREGTHSIHNSVREEFMADLEDIIHDG